MSKDTKYLKQDKKSGIYIFQKRVSDAVAGLLGIKSNIYNVSLGTDSLKEARSLRHSHLAYLKKLEDAEAVNPSYQDVMDKYKHMDKSRLEHELNSLDDDLTFTYAHLGNPQWEDLPHEEKIASGMPLDISEKDDIQYRVIASLAGKDPNFQPPEKYRLKLSAALEKHLEELSDLPKKTRGKYENSIRVFLSYVGQKDMLVYRIDRLTVRDFIKHCKAEVDGKELYADATVSNMLSNLGSVWEYARDVENLEKANPFRGHRITKKVSKKAEISSSKILMPMGMATLLGGMATTIGTSTNLLVVGIANDMGLEQIQLFDFVLPALIAGSIGMMFLWLVAPRLLPGDPPRSTKESTRIFEAALNVNEGEFTDGKTLSEVQEKAGSDFKIDKIKRSDSLFVAKIPSVIFEAGDRIYVKDTLENLQEYQDLLGLSLFEGEIGEDMEAESGSEVELAEVVITSGSMLDHTSLNALQFSSRFNLLPIAVHSGSTGVELKGDITAKTLNPGDVVLVQGSAEAIESLNTNSNMLVIENEDLDLGTKRSFVPLYIMVGVAALAATNLLPISIAAMLGLIGMLVFRLMNWSDVGNAMNIPIIMLIVASLSLGNALEITGGSDYLAELFVYLTGAMSVPLILSTLMLLMAALTNIVSNNAAAVIGTPIAINIAQQLGAPIEPFVLAVLFGANMSFVTPIGYKTNLLIMGAGGYKFNDFVKIGLPLAIIMWVAFSFILPALYL